MHKVQWITEIDIKKIIRIPICYSRAKPDEQYGSSAKEDEDGGDQEVQEPDVEKKDETFVDNSA